MNRRAPHLRGIDGVLSKAVVLGSLAAFITAIYVGIVVGIGALLGVGDQGEVELSILATTVVALAFQRVRARAQRFANRLVYGERAAPYEVMADFSRRVAGTLSVDQVLPGMAETAARGVGASAGRVRVFLADGSERAVSWPDLDPHADFTRRIGVTYQGEPIGEIAVAKPPSEPPTPAEERLLDDLARQAGLALHNVRLTEELGLSLEELSEQSEQLRLSRRRLVTARDAQRRGLERDIREGPQRQLREIGRQLAGATASLEADPGAADRLLDAVGGQANGTLEGLRDLARGIFPPLLADKGIVPALEAHIRKVAAAAWVEPDPGFADTRFDADTEAAVYFCCLQAVQNVLRHADNAPSSIRLRRDGETVEFTVSDQGPGFDPDLSPEGMGIQIMKDRVDALDGTLEVRSQPGHGTTVRGRVPARALDVAR
jgi:signal transduction histidine kinase